MWILAFNWHKLCKIHRESTKNQKQRKNKKKRSLSTRYQPMAIFREIKEGTRKGGERDTSDVESKWTVRHWVAKRKKEERKVDPVQYYVQLQ